MKDNTNYSKLEMIFKTNDGYITREDVDNANIPSWFLSDFVRKNNLNKIKFENKLNNIKNNTLLISKNLQTQNY